MKRFQNKLLILSFSIACIVSCKPYRNLEKIDSDSNINRFSNPIQAISKPLIYTAQLTFFKYSFDGLFIIKKEDQKKYRFAFTTKFGLRIFDFELDNFQLNKQYCIEQLDKNMVQSIFRQYFSILISQYNTSTSIVLKGVEDTIIVDSENKPEYMVYTFNLENQKLKTTESFKRKQMKVKAKFSDYKNNLPQNIHISHNKYNITFSLKSIQ